MTDARLADPYYLADPSCNSLSPVLHEYVVHVHVHISGLQKQDTQRSFSLCYFAYLLSILLVVYLKALIVIMLLHATEDNVSLSF